MACAAQPSHPTIHLGLAESTGDYEEIYRLRYDVYVGEQGKAYRTANHSRRILTDELDEHAKVLYARVNGQIVGTMRFNFGWDTAAYSHYAQMFGLHRFLEFGPRSMSFASRLAFLPDWRRSALIEVLLVLGYQVGRPPDVRFNFCTCRPALLGFFNRYGYRQIGSEYISADAGPQVPLALVGGDHEHLRSCRSPFLQFARSHPPDPNIREWFESNIAVSGNTVQEQKVSV